MKTLGAERSKWEKLALWSKLQHRKRPLQIWGYRHSSPYTIGGLFSNCDIWKEMGQR